ncbi:MAG TPA: gluconokinase, partial [Methylomirabilota bacterium]|nr:gluconokinase [Methylomirabilota bacterium]
DALLEAVARAVDNCLAGCGRRARDIGAAGASVFWHSLLGLDPGGAPLTPVLTWADTRSAGAAAELRERLDPGQVHARTGAPLHSTFFPAKLGWLCRSQPDLFGRAARWCGFAEYLLERLTGAWRASVSMASGTGLMDQAAAAWDRPLLDALGLDPGRLPPIDDAPAPGLAEPFQSRWPALAHVPWYPAWGDGACSNIGSECTGPERVALNLGTSSALRLVSPDGDRPGFGPPPGLWRYRVDARRSLVGGATSEGGNVVAWCRGVLRLPPDAEAVERAVAAVGADSHGLTALPFLAGERSPGWRADARGAVVGLSLGTTPAAVLRAMMEAVAYRLALIHERLAPLADPRHRVIASGGALHASPAWAEIVADVLGAPLELCPEPEASARGAALLALERLGAAAPPPLPPGPTVTPDPRRHALYRAALNRQRGLYDTVVGPPLS